MFTIPWGDDEARVYIFLYNSSAPALYTPDPASNSSSPIPVDQDIRNIHFKTFTNVMVAVVDIGDDWIDNGDKYYIYRDPDIEDDGPYIIQNGSEFIVNIWSEKDQRYHNIAKKTITT